MLEELGLEYDVVPISTQKGEQKSPEYLKLNPNGRTPTLVDHSNGDFVLWCEERLDSPSYPERMK